jgi:hypothetical protein
MAVSSTTSQASVFVGKLNRTVLGFHGERVSTFSAGNPFVRIMPTEAYLTLVSALPIVRANDSALGSGLEDAEALRCRNLRRV